MDKEEALTQRNMLVAAIEKHFAQEEGTCSFVDCIKLLDKKQFGVEAVTKAIDEIGLAPGMQWGADAMKQFNYGKKRAKQAVLFGLRGDETLPNETPQDVRQTRAYVDYLKHAPSCGYFTDTACTCKRSFGKKKQ